MDKAKSGFNGQAGEFGWEGAAGATILVDPQNEFSFFYSHHMLNPQEDYYQPRIRHAAYNCLFGSDYNTVTVSSGYISLILHTVFFVKFSGD